MVADMFHIGHLKALQNAKRQGSYLIVGVLTDKACMEKKERPIVSYEERKAVLKSIGIVDQIVIQHDYSPLNNVKRIKPDILMECNTHVEFPANDYVESYGGKVVVTKYYKPQSSTKIKNKILKCYR